MSKIPLPAGEAILTGVEWRYIAVTGLLQAVVTLSVFVWALKARDPNRPFWELGVFSNLPLFGVVASSALVQIAIHHITAAQSLLRIGSLSTTDCLLSIAIGMVPLGVLDGVKLVKRALTQDGVGATCLIHRLSVQVDCAGATLQRATSATQEIL